MLFPDEDSYPDETYEISSKFNLLRVLGRSKTHSSLNLPALRSNPGSLMASRESSWIPRSMSAYKDDHLYPYSDFLLMFDTSSGSNKVSYCVIDSTAKRNHIIPKMSSKHLGKIQDLIGYCVVVMDNFLYVIGGMHLKSGTEMSSCYKFDPNTNRWQTIANLNCARSRHTATVLDSSIFVCGGQAREGRFTDTVERYDVISSTWTACRRMFSPRADHSACAVQGKLLVCGGVSEKSGPHSNLWSYDPVSDFWTQAYGSGALPRPKDSHSMVEHEGKVYVLGGLTLCRAGAKVMEEEDERLVSFDCSKVVDPMFLGFWDKSHPDMTRVRSKAATVVLGHYIYHIGGQELNADRPQLVVERYNMKRKRWREAFRLPGPGSGSMACCVLRVPSTNKEFSTLGLAINKKWILW